MHKTASRSINGSRDTAVQGALDYVEASVSRID